MLISVKTVAFLEGPRRKLIAGREHLLLPCCPPAESALTGALYSIVDDRLDSIAPSHIVELLLVTYHRFSARLSTSMLRNSHCLR